MTIPEVLIKLGLGLLLIAASGLIFYVLVADVFGPPAARPNERIHK